MPRRYEAKPRTWGKKFGDALAAVPMGVRKQDSFYFHLVVATLVVIAGIVLQLTRLEWCLITLCIFLVLSAEMFNRALEILAKAITKNHSRELELGLNVASAAVLLAATAAVIVGLLVFVPHLLEWLPARR